MKILCLADNSSPDAWGHIISSKYAQQKKLKFNGLLKKTENYTNGVYHVGPMDLDTQSILEIAKKNFNKVVFVDQPQEKFSHSRIFLNLWKLIKDLRDNQVKVDEENKEILQYLYDWEKIFEDNRHICVLPFTEIHNHNLGGLNLCGRSMHNVITEKTVYKNIVDSWRKGKNINKIRKNMLNGQKNYQCNTCHTYEEKNIRDQRWNYSFDWIAKLQLKKIEDLKKLKNPLHYNIRLSNKCNLMCKMCSSEYSHLIEKENKTIKNTELRKFIPKTNYKYNGDFENIDVNTAVSVYITGGEPSFNHATFKFLEKCINSKKTNFKINIQTNAAKITPKFFNLIKHFTNITMNCSVDGVGKVNEYQRWLLDSELQKKNILEFYRQGHHIHITHVVSIYNVSTIGDTFSFFDSEFPFASVQLQWASFKEQILSPYNHPNKKLVLKSLEKAKQSRCYWHNESGTTEIINNLYKFYENVNLPINTEKLKKFFWYNDNLDYMRGSKLIDYIPTLEECRKYIK